ncbi:MAG: hypothetical protein JNJ54_30115 [Myxococcaceae bacterium]|nr:hypothetical protein [Myxococcaceae bacterium]
MLTFLAAAALASTAVPFSPPPMVDAPSVTSTPRQARLVDEEGMKASSPVDLAGRMVMAPVLGAVGGVLGGVLGFGAGALVGAVARAGSWGSLGVGFIVGALVSFVGLAIGTAIGASLFGDDFKGRFGRSIGWAFLAMGVATAISVVAILVLPTIGLAVSLGAGVVSAAAVPLIVEARAMATVEPERRAPEATLAVATF